MKNTFILLLILIGMKPSFAEQFTVGRTLFDYDISSIIDFNTEDDAISIYNTGLNLKAKNENGFSANLATAIDGKIDEINSDNFPKLLF